jgi:hypothetical protein
LLLPQSNRQPATTGFKTRITPTVMRVFVCLNLSGEAGGATVATLRVHHFIQTFEENMSITFKKIQNAVVIGFIVGFSGAAQAQTASVTRCNVLEDGKYVPVLLVTQNGASSQYRIGQEGLTRGIAFSDKRALDWARVTLGLEVAVYADCSADSDSFGPLAAVVLPPPPPVEETTEEEEASGEETIPEEEPPVVPEEEPPVVPEEEPPVPEQETELETPPCVDCSGQDSSSGGIAPPDFVPPPGNIDFF